MKKSFLVIVAMALLEGCNTTGDVSGSTRVRVLNHSEKDIIFVVLDPDGYTSPFGFMSNGPSGKTVTGSRVRYAADFAIEWEEEGESQRAMVDISHLGKRRKTIQLLTFTYMGNRRWDVLAEDKF